MFAASFAVVALLAGVLLWMFVRQSGRFGSFARSAPAEAAPGRTRRAGDGLVYHPPADPVPPPVLAPVPLGLSPAQGADADEEEAEVRPVPRAHAGWDDADEEYDQAESDAGFATLRPELAAVVPLRLDPLAPEPDNEVEPEPGHLPAPAPEPLAAAEEPALDWPETAALRLRELDALVAAGGFAAYFAEVRAPHAWDEMIEALRAVGAAEAADVATAAGEVQWVHHQQGALAPPQDFAEADAHWSALAIDLPALLEAWHAAQRERRAQGQA